MRPIPRAAIPLLLVALSLSGCGGFDESGTAAKGNVTVYLTDAPSYALDNVWVTVSEVWFHKVETAPFDNTSGGWVRFSLDNGVTVNLAALSGDNNVVKVFDNLSLPAATYRQMLLFLAPTESARTVSANAQGLRFNNQVDAGTLRAALRVPNAAQGIRVADRSFQVDNAALLRVAVDFDLGRDVLPFNRGAVREFLLQPRPRSFDLDNAGAIVGYIDNATPGFSTAFPEVLAEQKGSGLGARVVRRTAAVDNVTGRFVLYPLDLGTYDIVIAGQGWETVIVNQVPANVRAIPTSGATVVATATSPLRMFSGTDFSINAIINAPGPTGATANFYQTLATGQVGEVPYLIRARNFDPLSGRIDGLRLSSGPLHAGTFGSGIVLFSPVPSNGSFTAVAAADLFLPSGTPGDLSNVNPFWNGQDFPFLSLTANAPAGTTVSGQLSVPQSTIPLDNAFVFATRGGTIVSARSLAPVVAPSVVPYGVLNLPGGTTLSSFALGNYAVGAYGWTNSAADNTLRVGAYPGIVNLQAGTPTTSFDFTMANAPAP